MTWNFDLIWPYIPQLLKGAEITSLLAGIVFALGFAVGLVVALIRISSSRLLRILAIAYIDFFRTTPLTVQLIWCFFVLPVLLGSRLDAFLAAVVAMSLNTAAFAAEILRSGIQSVPPGQRDAARVLGFSRLTTFARVIWPQAFRTALPPLAVLAMLIVKGTSLAAGIGVLELTHTTNRVSLATLHSIEAFTVSAAIYFILAFPFAIIAWRLEKRMKIGAAVPTAPSL